MDKTSALMLTGQYKQLVAASHELNQAYQRLDRAANDLAKRINSPIEPEERNSVMRSVMILRDGITGLEKALGFIANTSIVIGDATASRLSSENVASELVKIARELTAGGKIVAIFPGENPRSPHMFYQLGDDGMVRYFMSGGGGRGSVVADSYERFIRMVDGGNTRAVWVEDGRIADKAPRI